MHRMHLKENYGRVRVNTNTDISYPQSSIQIWTKLRTAFSSEKENVIIWCHTLQMKTQGETRLIYKYIKGKKIAYFNVNKEGEIA